MESAGWKVVLPFQRFWDGERSKEEMLKGLTDENNIQFVSWVYDTYLEPLMKKKPAGLKEQVHYCCCAITTTTTNAAVLILVQ